MDKEVKKLRKKGVENLSKNLNSLKKKILNLIKKREVEEENAI